MKQNKFISAAAVLIAAFSVACSSIAAHAESAGAVQAAQQLVISDRAGLEAFAEDCRLDSYSKNLSVTLAADIELSGEFAPIPVFGGSFDGNGHTVSGLKITEDGSYSGLFRYIQRGALVKNLTVKGTVSPSGSAGYAGGIAGSNAGSIINCSFEGTVRGTEYIGGIAGINEKSGLISGCAAAGAITGGHYTGGTAGSSSGTIMNCSSRCSVNTTASEARLSIKDIDWDSIISSEEPASMTDAGGIAGFSDGIIQGCENFGTVGYPHIGYNVGGIVGRQSGFVNGCTNRGEIFGRKDIGGIAGQMEPYQSIDFDKDTTQKLLDEMDVLGELTDKLISDAKTGGDEINGKVQGLTWQMEQLRRSADNIAERTEELYNGWTDGINEISARADEALDGIAPALDSARRGLDLLSRFSSSLQQVFYSISASSDDMQAAIGSAEEGIDTLNGAISEISGALDDINAAADELSGAMGDTDRVESAVRSIIKALGNVNGGVADISSAMTKIGNACDDLRQWVTGRDLEELSDGLTALGGSMQSVSRALSKMSAALQKIAGAADPDQIQKGLDQFSEAAADLNNAMIHAAAALRAASGAIPDADKISSELEAASADIISAGEKAVKAVEQINSAIDTMQLKEGISALENALSDLSGALQRADSALGDITGAIDGISGSRAPENAFDEISEQAERINGMIRDISGYAEDINKALDEITSEIDSGKLKDGMQSISDAAKKLSSAADGISSAAGSLDEACGSISDVLDTLEGAAQSASDASGYLSEACGAFSDAAEQLSDTVRILSDKPAVEFPAADEEFTAAVNGFSADLSGITSALSAISSTASAQSGILLDDFQAVTDELGKITDILQELKDKVINSDNEYGTAADVSENDSSSRHGKVLSCGNYGGVQGDLNVGGITGSMAIDFDFDPEDDIASSGERSFRYSYKIRDIIEGCANSGEITAKKNYCGGIVGRMDMGAVRDSVENGKVSSTGGSYAGGIAGFSSAAIRNCISRASISAAGYVGGIAGQGLILSDNAAILEISGCAERCGAIAGYADLSDDRAEILRNRFVDRGTAGIDGISYAGIAAPVDFEEYAKLAGGTAIIEVSFIADGKVIDTIQTDFGGSIAPADLPDIPEKAGCFAKWPEFDSGCITFPMEVEAVYTDYVTEIESAEQSESKFPLVLADGIFDDESSISVHTESSSVFPPDSSSELRLVRLECGLPEGSITKLRFLVPDGTGAPNVMQYINGAWKSVSFTNNGNYLIVDNPQLENGAGYFCVQLQRTDYLPLIIIGGCAVVAVINVVLWVILIRRKRAAKKEQGKIPSANK